MTPAIVALLAAFPQGAPNVRLGNLSLSAPVDAPLKTVAYTLKGVEKQRIASVTTRQGRRKKAVLWAQILTPKKGFALTASNLASLSDQAARTIVGSWGKRTKEDSAQTGLTYYYRSTKLAGVAGNLDIQTRLAGGKIYRVLLFSPAAGTKTGKGQETFEGVFEQAALNSIVVSGESNVGAAAATTSGKLTLILTSDGKPVGPGSSIGGERPIRLSVTGNSAAINQVEFYVNGELRDTDTSTPYEFKLDTVVEEEGPIKLRFKASTFENENGEIALTLKVDNEVAKGAAYHVAKANDLLSEGKYAAARDEGRIAMKAEKGFFDARLVLARAYTGLGEFDQAQLQAEEAKAVKPEDPNVLTLLAGINVQRAFRIYAKPGADRTEVLKGIKDALVSAVESRRQALDSQLDSLKGDADPVARGDAALRARRYSAAITILTPAFANDQKNAALADRLAYAQVRSNRRQDAINTLNSLQRAGGLTAYGYALRAVALADGGDDAASDEAIREAVLSDSENLGVRTAQAYIALKRGKNDVLSRLSADLQKEQGQRPDVRYFQMALAAREQRYSDASRAFQIGVLAEPAMSDLYVEYANDAIAITQRGNIDPKEKAQHYAEARAYFEVALVARPEASEALSGLAMVAIFENKSAEAVRYAEAAVRAAPTDPGAHYALSAAQAAFATAVRSRDAAAASTASGAAQASNLRAGELDSKYLKGRQIPDAAAVWRYMDTAGRPTVIAAPTE